MPYSHDKGLITPSAKRKGKHNNNNYPNAPKPSNPKKANTTKSQSSDNDKLPSRTIYNNLQITKKATIIYTNYFKKVNNEDKVETMDEQDLLQVKKWLNENKNDAWIVSRELLSAQYFFKLKELANQLTETGINPKQIIISTSVTVKTMTVCSELYDKAKEGKLGNFKTIVGDYDKAKFQHESIPKTILLLVLLARHLEEMLLLNEKTIVSHITINVDESIDLFTVASIAQLAILNEFDLSIMDSPANKPSFKTKIGESDEIRKDKIWKAQMKIITHDLIKCVKAVNYKNLAQKSANTMPIF